VTQTTKAVWRQALGPAWELQLVFFGLCLFAAGATVPLADPDLPIHLATGEWVMKNRSVPFTEPWAWTRPNAPFFAYSWAIETLYYLILVGVGPIGLHLLQGLTYVALGASILVLGQVSGWRPWTTIVIAATHLIVTLGATPFLRPQAILLIATPLVWALVLRARDVERLRWELPALTLVSAAVANTHLLFPLTAAPCVLLLTRLPERRRRLVLIPLAIVVGWFLTPYAVHWVDTYRLYFAPNALLSPPTPIAEYKPGFTMALTAGVSSLLVCFGLVVLPWLVGARYDVRERALYGFLWLAGFTMFALAVRGLVVWWLLVIPCAALAVEALPEPSLARVRTAQRGLVLAIFAAVGMLAVEEARDPSLRAGSVTTRFLPSMNARAIEPIAEWLDCNVRKSVGGRLVTTFNYGGYVPWRLPYLSESIDGRTFFPDSVAKAETYFRPNQAAIPLPPWKTADLAILPVGVPLAGVLDTAAGWRRVAITSQLEGRASMIGLWVTDRWWLRAGNGTLAPGLLPLPHRFDREHACPAPSATTELERSNDE
jgi:hypothetical protein